VQFFSQVTGRSAYSGPAIQNTSPRTSTCRVSKRPPLGTASEFLRTGKS
jgi:hypothetical protein